MHQSFVKLNFWFPVQFLPGQGDVGLPLHGVIAWQRPEKVKAMRSVLKNLFWIDMAPFIPKSNKIL